MIAQHLENLYIYKKINIFLRYIEWFYLTDAWAKAVADSYMRVFLILYSRNIYSDSLDD
jgi:hypothetical protein